MIQQLLFFKIAGCLLNELTLEVFNIMKNILNVFLFFFTALCVQGCNTEKNIYFTKEKQELTLPISNWLEIADVDGGQVLKPLNPYLWKDKESSTVFINGSGELTSLEGTEEYFANSDFGGVVIKQIHPKQVVKNLNNSLNQLVKAKHYFKEIYHLRIFHEDIFAYDLLFYSDDKELKYITVCIEYCNNSDEEVIIVSKK